jgi:3-phenylpropionate/trans-cinnamate dioxygenase ferredoxin reductase component
MLARSVAHHDEEIRLLGSVVRFVWQGVNFPRRLIGGRLARADSTPLSALAKGRGSVIQVGGEKIAVYKDDEGTAHAVSPVCTHLRCIVEWNSAEKTWNCPCHGSRFDYQGRVIRGPAKRDLAPKKLT